ncbi:MAG: PH domain-containing protein [Firmicutes bacterium]|nr:PH domain-containing protein [Bacillota bacterium]
MEKKKIRCHFSIIFESLWKFWVVIFILLLNELEVIIEIVQDIGKDGIMAFLETGGIWGLLILVAITLIVFGIQFFRWRKTWIILEDNLVIIERNTLKKVKNTIAIENISAVNMERNLFERIVGTYRIKMDTNSMTTANETDVSIVFREDVAIAFRKTILERMHKLKGNLDTSALSEERQPDELTKASAGDRKVFHYSPLDMVKHSFYSMHILGLLISIGGIGGMIWYVSEFGWYSFLNEALGGLIAVVIMVIGSIYGIVKNFFKYYDFTVYRDGKDLHIKCGLIKLRSYTIPVDKITAITVQQPVIARLFGKYHVEVTTVGMQDEDGENSNITMALSKEECITHMEELVPEYYWDGIFDYSKEEKGGAMVRVVKSIKWHVLVIIAMVLLFTLAEAPWYIAVLAPLAFDLFVCLLYILSHKTAGYKIKEEGLVLVNGYFAKHISLVKYQKAQVLTMTYHPVAKRYGIGDGTIMLLNTAVSVPYIKEDLASEISDRIIGGTTK